MESDPVSSHHGITTDQSISIMQPIDFHCTTQKQNHHTYYGPSQSQSTWDWKMDPVRYGGDLPYHHLAIWATITAQWY